MSNLEMFILLSKYAEGVTSYGDCYIPLDKLEDFLEGFEEEPYPTIEAEILLSGSIIVNLERLGNFVEDSETFEEIALRELKRL